MILPIKHTVLCLLVLFATDLTAEAAKGDRQPSVRRSSPLLEGKVLDLRFAGFAQGIWARQTQDCDNLSVIDRGVPGSLVAIYRGLLETPDQICQVYGAEKRSSGAQRAAMNCRLTTGSETLGLVTVRPRGTEGITVQDGDHPAVHYRFCRAITPLIQTTTQ